jgi:hypothetical protein
MASTLPQTQLRLEIFKGHQFLYRFLPLANPRVPLIAGLLSLAAFLAAASIDGHLLQSHLPTIICRDALTYLQAKHVCHRYSLSRQMWALRDLPSLILLFLVPMTVPLAIRQWENISCFLSAMADRGILTVSNEKLVYGEISACNSYFLKWAARNPVVVMAAILAVLLIVRSQTTGSVYPFLEVSHHSYGIAPHNWWLTLDGVSVAGMLFFAVGVVVVYVIFIQTIQGSRVVLLLWRTRSAMVADVDVESSDGYYGWSEVRGILLATWSLIIIHGISLAMVGLSLPRKQPFEFVLAPLLFQWIIVSPIYLFLPYWITRRHVVSWKHDERARLRLSIATETTDAGRRALEQQVANLRKIRVNPFSGILQSILFIIGTIASIVFVVDIILHLYN